MKLIFFFSQTTTGTEKKKNNAQKLTFNIKNENDFTEACNYANGAIIGSAFIQHLEKNPICFGDSIPSFVKKIRT